MAAYHRLDDCYTAGDVWSRAHKVHRMKQQWRQSPQPKRPPEPEPEPEPDFEIPELANLNPNRNWLILYPGHISLAEIQEAVCRAWGIGIIDLKSARKHGRVIVPRQISWVLMKCLTYRSFTEIGRATGNRDHSTVIHGIRKYEALMAQLRAEIPLTDPLWNWVKRAWELTEGKAYG